MSRQLMIDAVAAFGTVSLFAAALGGPGVVMARGGAVPAPVVMARQTPATPAEPRVIEVVAKRFAFEPARIEVTEGEHVRLMVKSADGVHGFEIKKFRVNKIVPRGGKPVTIDFVASAPGTFEIMCSEECGDGHESMTGSLVVTAKAK